MKILAADLWPPGRNVSYAEASKLELVRGQMRLRQLIENVLLYDQVVLPTDNFLSLRFLAQAFGVEALAILMDEDILKFNRFSGQLAYAGASHGLTVIKVDVARTAQAKGSVGAAWMPTGVAATAILSDLPGITPLRAKQIAAKVVHATKETELSAIIAKLRGSTYEAAHSSEMDPRLRLSNPNLNDLGIRADQVRILGDLEDRNASDDIDKLMLIARTELELFAKEKNGCDDLSTLSPWGRYLLPNWGTRHR